MRDGGAGLAGEPFLEVVRRRHPDVRLVILEEPDAEPDVTLDLDDARALVGPVDAAYELIRPILPPELPEPTRTWRGVAGGGHAYLVKKAVGSPGVGGGNEHATDLLESGDVWVGSAKHDPVTHLGNESVLGLGNDPAQEDFGGKRFAVDDGSYRFQDLLDNHTSYFDADSTSLDNVAGVMTGQDPDLVDGRNVPGAVTLPGLLGGSAAASGYDEVVAEIEEGYGEIKDGAGWVKDRAEDITGALDPRGWL